MAMEMITFYRIMLFLMLLLTNICFATQTKVLIINSDIKVSRYQKIISEFKNTLPENYQTINLDLEKNTDTESGIKRVIEKENPDFVYCLGTTAYMLSKEVADDRFLIFSAAINWERFNLNNKTYGIANELLPEQDMTLMRLIFPDIKKIGILYNKDFNQEYVNKIKKTFETVNIEIITRNVANTDEIHSVLSSLLPEIEMLWLIADPVVLYNQQTVKEIFAVTKQKNKPVYAYNEAFIDSGAILSAAPDDRTIGRQAAKLIMALQQNNVPALKVQVPAGSNIVLNRCIASALKMPLNMNGLDSVNRIIDCKK